MPRSTSAKNRRKAGPKTPIAKKQENEAMESTAKKSQTSSALQLQAQAEQEVKAVFHAVTADILKGGPEPGAVTNLHKRQLVQTMVSYPALFQKSLLLYIERVLAIEGEDQFLKNFFLLLERVFAEMVKPVSRQNDPLRTNGPLLMKSVLKRVLEIYNFPRLLAKLQQRCGGFLAMIVSATSQRVEEQPKTSGKENSAMKEEDPGEQEAARRKPRYKFNLLNQSISDKELRAELEQTVLQMLLPAQTTTLQAHGIHIAALMSDCTGDSLFISMLRLLGSSRSAEIRKRIVRALKAPYSHEALAFLGRRLRDVNGEVIVLVFSQLASEGVTIEDFPSAEARLLVLKEGLSSNDEQVREACIKFYSPTVLKYRDNLATLFEMIDARLAFINQYYTRVPCLVILAIFQILPDEMIILNYIEKVVFAKLYKMIPGEPKEDVEMNEEDQPPSPPTTDYITFEELYFTRLTYEITQDSSSRRLPEYVDRMFDILPEIDRYKTILYAIAEMPEKGHPVVSRAIKDDKETKPHPKGEEGFTRRAILGEWVKFSLQMDIKEETIRQNLISLCFELISRVEYSYSDYEHLLRQGKQSISNIAKIDLAAVEEYDESLIARCEDGEQNVDIVLSLFENIGSTRPIQEYCKPYALEQLTLDFDDVCLVAISVAKRLLGKRIEEFQRDMVQIISDIKEQLEEPADESPNPYENNEPAMMVFSQISAEPVPQAEGRVPTFKSVHKSLMQQLESNIDQLQSFDEDDEDYEEKFNKKYCKVQKLVLLVEEINLKEKLCNKRALRLCQGLLKHCQLADVNDQNVVSTASALVHPAVSRGDTELVLQAIECFGLLIILDREVFISYVDTFQTFLSEEEPLYDNLHERVVAIKSVVDGLMIHGICDEKAKGLFDTVTSKYLTIRQKVLRQVTIEGVCKMLFSPKLCDENDQEQVESILAKLIMLLFDKRYNLQNSFVRSVITITLRNFVLMSEKRCKLLLNALTKVIYSCIRAKYGVAVKNKAKPVKQAKKKAKSKPKKRLNQASDSDSEFDQSSLDDLSLDSDEQLRVVEVEKICEHLDANLILRGLLPCLQRAYINPKNEREQQAIFHMKHELTVVFLRRLLVLNLEHFKKTAVVKEIVLSILEETGIADCDSLPLLNNLQALWGQNVSMLVQKSAKVAKFEDRLNLRITELEELQDDEEEKQAGAGGQQDVEMEAQWQDDFEPETLEQYWLEHVMDKRVDKAQDDDSDLVEQNRVWLGINTRDKLNRSKSPKRCTDNHSSPAPVQAAGMKPTTGSQRSSKQSPQAPSGRRRAARAAAKKSLAPILEDASDGTNIKRQRSKKAKIIPQSVQSEISEDEQAEEEMEEIVDSEQEGVKHGQGNKDESKSQTAAGSLVNALNGLKSEPRDEQQKWRQVSKGQISFNSSRELRQPPQASKHASKLTIAEAKSQSKQDQEDEEEAKAPPRKQDKTGLKPDTKVQQISTNKSQRPLRQGRTRRRFGGNASSVDVSKSSESAAGSMDDTEGADGDVFEVLQGRATRRRRIRNRDQKAVSKSMDSEQLKPKKVQGVEPVTKPDKKLARTAINKSKTDEKENVQAEGKASVASTRGRSRRARNR